MTQKLEALHLEALCEEVGLHTESRGAVTTVLWWLILLLSLPVCLSAGPAAENPEAL